MDIKITAKNLKLTPAIKAYAQERVGKIEHFAEDVVWAQMVLSVERKISQRAEVIIHFSNKQTITASAVEGDMYVAIDAAAAKAEAQVRKIKGKKITKRVKGGSIKEGAETTSVFLDPVFSPQNDIRFSVIKQVEVRPMNPEDAAYEMERLGYTFWMFLDEDSKQLNLIFKRLDGTYGLIKPIKKK